MTLNVLSQHYVVLPKVFEVGFYFSFAYIILSGQVILSSSFFTSLGPLENLEMISEAFI